MFLKTKSQSGNRSSACSAPSERCSGRRSARRPHRLFINITTDILLDRGAAAAAMEVNGLIDAVEDALLRLGAGLAGVDGAGISPAATFSSSRAHASSRAFACKAALATGAAARRVDLPLVDSRAFDSNSEESATRDSDALVSVHVLASRWASSASDLQSSV